MSRPRSHRSASIALALLFVPVAGFVLLRPDQAIRPATRDTSEPAPTAVTRGMRTQRPSRPKFRRSQLAGARASARRFVAQYVEYVHGRASARTITAAAAELARELRRHRARVTPAQQRHAPSIRRLTTEPGAGTVRAVAAVQDRDGPPYTLAFYLERRGRSWLVTRLSDS